MKKTKRLLIPSVGSLAAPFVVERAKKMGFDIIGMDVYPREWIHDLPLLDAFYQVPRSDDPKYSDCLSKIIDQEHVSHLLPITDFDIDFLIAERFEENRPDLICLVSLDDDLAGFRDKLMMSRKLSECAMPCIKTCMVKEANIESFSYPAICKPRFGRSSERTCLVKSSEDIAPAWRDDLNMIIQPFIEGEIVTCDLIKKGADHVYVARTEHTRTSNGAGISVSTFKDEQLDKIIEAFCRHFEFLGCINIECIRTQDDYLIMDINPRFSAGVVFSSVAGYDFVSNHIRSLEGSEIEPLDNLNECLMKRGFGAQPIIGTDN